MIVAPGAIVGGRYRLNQKLARGGMGSVWIGRHRQLEVDVAIKFMDPSIVSSPTARSRFEREGRAAAQLQHPNIVHVYDFGFEGETPFLVMELLRGESLEERLQRERRLSLQAIASLLVQMSKGLRRAHESGFVHRDLKPGNIFISTSSDEEIVKILDFGIAKQIGGAIDNGTKTGEIIGSPHYMSPEQIAGVKDIDGRSDLWSLGVILYRAATGDLPFPGDTVGAVVANIFSAPVPKPSHRLRGLPGAIDGFFERAFARDRAQRFQTAREMTDAFLQLAASATPGPIVTSRDSGGSIPSPVAAANITVPPSTEPATVPEGRRQAAPRVRPATRFQEKRGVALAALLAFGAITLLLVLVIVLRRPQQPGGSPAEVPSSSAHSAASSAASALATASVSASAPPADPAQPEAAPSASDSGQPTQIVPPGGKSAQLGAPSSQPVNDGSPGTVSVVSKNGACKVAINGESRGLTPFSTFVKPGWVTISCKKVGGTATKRVFVGAGKAVPVLF